MVSRKQFAYLVKRYILSKLRRRPDTEDEYVMMSSFPSLIKCIFSSKCAFRESPGDPGLAGLAAWLVGLPRRGCVILLSCCHSPGGLLWKGLSCLLNHQRKME